MFNLLPPYWQKKLEEEELFKTVTILGTVATAASLSFILMLMLVKIYFSIELKNVQVVTEEKAKEMEIFGINEAEKEITLRNKFVAKVNEFYSDQMSITEMVARVAQTLPAGVTLSRLSLANNNTINLSGYSPDRNSLIAFKSNLEKEPSFRKVVFPPENWLMAQNIAFDINFKYESQ